MEKQKCFFFFFPNFGLYVPWVKRVNGFLICLGWAEPCAVWAGPVMGAKNLEDKGPSIKNSYHIYYFFLGQGARAPLGPILPGLEGENFIDSEQWFSF